MPTATPTIESLVPYQPGRSADEIRELYGLDRVIKLASNENPLGPSPLALEAVRDAFKHAHLYPRGGFRLRRKLALRYNVGPENVMVGAGSESVLLSVLRAYITSDEEVLTADGTFIGFYVMARAQGLKLVTVPLKDYRYDLDAIADAVSERTKLIYLANPNNPTGTIFSRAEFERFIARVPTSVLIVLDEAYFEYSRNNPEFPDSQSYRLDNVITLRTFSKAYGLAGARIGYGIAEESIAATVNKVKLPFDPSSLSEAAGLGALDDNVFLRTTLEVNQQGKEYLLSLFDQLGIRSVPTEANFYLMILDNEQEALLLADNLLKSGVILRPLRAFNLPHCLRVTIGKPDEIEFLESTLRKILQPATV